MGGSGTQDLTITADGIIDFAGSEASLQVSSPMMGTGSSMQVVLADGVGYVKVPMFGDKGSSPTKGSGPEHGRSDAGPRDLAQGCRT